MTEIRLCRTREVLVLTGSNLTEGEPWTIDTPESRNDLVLLVMVGNELFGEHTHWIEERVV